MSLARFTSLRGWEVSWLDEKYRIIKTRADEDFPIDLKTISNVIELWCAVLVVGRDHFLESPAVENLLFDLKAIEPKEKYSYHHFMWVVPGLSKKIYSRGIFVDEYGAGDAIKLLFEWRLCFDKISIANILKW